VATIERVDMGDDEMFVQFHEVYRRAHERDIDRPYSAAEIRADLRPDEYVDKVALLARDDDGNAVAGGAVELPLRDNPDVAYADVFTAAEHRRRGHATTIVEAVEQLVGKAGRSTVYAEAVWELDAVDPAPQAFIESCGFRLDLMDAVRELRLPAVLPSERVADGYAIDTWRGSAPDERVRGYTDIRSLLAEEAPAGDTPLENEFWDVARTRAEEERWVQQGRTPHVGVAVTDDGEVVGYTQLLFPADSEEVYQWDTLVLPTHRGHGLGLALKVAVMRAAAEDLAGRRRITTYNAAKNEPMTRVNEALGYRQVGWVGEYVKTL
jgi:GNAT superfamily N-acetyltransferase